MAAVIEGLDRLNAKLARRAAQARRDAGSVIVGFTAAYAVYVHENLESFHPVGQSKFLEQPARAMKPEFGRIIRTAVSRGTSLIQALLLAGLRLQREAQELTPVLTGNLRASAFTRKED